LPSAGTFKAGIVANCEFLQQQQSTIQTQNTGALWYNFDLATKVPLETLHFRIEFRIIILSLSEVA